MQIPPAIRASIEARWLAHVVTLERIAGRGPVAAGG